MFPFIMIPFFVFFVCCALQFVFARRIRVVLAERHPEVWREMSTKALFIDNAVMRFAGRRGDKGLNDPDLSAKTRQLAMLRIVAFASWLAFAVCLFAGPVLGLG